jgi:hypothetical protein
MWIGMEAGFIRLAHNHNNLQVFNSCHCLDQLSRLIQLSPFGSWSSFRPSASVADAQCLSIKSFLFSRIDPLVYLEILNLN